MKKKQFDCVEMMHRGARRIYEDTRGMSRPEELQYWQQQAARLMLDNGGKPGRRRSAREPRVYRTTR